MANDDLRRRREEDAQRGPEHDDPEHLGRRYLPDDPGAPPEPARIPEPWPPPDEADRPSPDREERDDPGAPHPDDD